MTDENEPYHNRAQRRQAARVDRHAEATGAAQQEKIELGAAMLMQTIATNRIDVVNRLVNALFDEDPGGTIMRLKGIGGATGVMSVETLTEIANAAVTAGLILPSLEQVEAAQEMEAQAEAQADAAAIETFENEGGQS